MATVPVPRTLQEGRVGNDVLALERALVAAGVRKNAPSRQFGPHCTNQVKRFQYAHHLPVDGVAGPVTISVLSKSRTGHPYGYYDAYGVYLIHEWMNHHPPAPTNPAEAAVRQALWGAANRWSIRYAEIRPMPLVRFKAHALPFTTDCSGFYTCCYYAAGLPDPNGRGYDGQGYTGTMLQHGKVVSEPEPGDACFYYHPISHVAMYIGNGKVVSHGSPSNPVAILPWNYVPPTEIRRYV
jgi:hypothetical protein